MTEIADHGHTVGDEHGRCGWCRRVIAPKAGPGRPKKFCSQKCRQWNWVARERADELNLSENELVIARSELDSLHDDLYVLACAIEDTERDLASLDGVPSAHELRGMIGWLIESARPLRGREISVPRAPAKSS